MNTTAWQCDEHGTQNLRMTVNGMQGHIWIQGRRPYCDRGHWEWGSMGLMLDRAALPTPSYYFMDRETARAELEEWLARMQGAVSATRSLDTQADTVFTQAQGKQNGWRWQADGQGALIACARHDGAPTRLALRAISVQGGPAFVLTVEEGMSVDGADCFPRVYMDLDRAMQETEAFMAWRLLEHPAAIPGPIQEADQPVGQLLRDASPKAKNRPRVR